MHCVINLLLFQIADEFYTVVETVETHDDMDNDNSMNSSGNDAIKYNIDLTTLNEITTSHEPSEKQKKQMKYKCNKCDAQFPLRVDLKVSTTFTDINFRDNQNFDQF